MSINRHPEIYFKNSISCVFPETEFFVHKGNKVSLQKNNKPVAYVIPYLFQNVRFQDESKEKISHQKILF